MKKLLAISAAVAAVAILSTGLYARGMGGGYCGGPGAGYGMGFGPGMMYEDLNLTDEQLDKIHKLNMEYREKAWKERDTHRKAIEKILTPEQKKKLEDAKKDRRNNWKNEGKRKRMHDRYGDGRGMMMGAALDLSDEQIEKIHKINMEYADKFYKNRKNTDELKKLRESRDKDIEKILTKEQLEQFRELRDNRGYRDCPYYPED